MKKYIKLLLFVLPIALHAAGTNPKEDKTKIIKKSFELKNDGILKVVNSFGDVAISTWDQEKVEIKITIYSRGNTSEREMQRIDNTEIIFKNTLNEVSASTEFDNSSSGWGWFKNVNNNSSLRVDYEIRMPVKANLYVSNDYGSIILDRLEGHANLNCDFGSLKIGQLLRRDNQLSFDYTKNSSIDYIKTGKIQADFSSIKIYGSDELDIKGDYSTFNFEKNNNLAFNSDFSTFNINESKIVYGRGDYSTITLDRIIKGIDLKTDFGTINIKELTPSTETVTINSSYTKVAIGYHPELPFRFNINTEYASLKTDDSLTVKYYNKDGSDIKKSGYYKTENAACFIEIQSEFGGVSLTSKN